MTGIPKRQRNAEAAHADMVRQQAYANPHTRCCTCGQLLEHCGPNRDGHNANGTPCTWDAGHPDGRWPGNQLKPECSACNRSRGATDGNRRREPHSERW